ncbi:MAG: response regulator transcription factor [Anaerolineaceae bacterium]|nr:response regulator transcription factor [Anaerolineaceae bacterium]
MRILVIEDDKRLARLIGTVLEEEGLSYDIAHEGDIGLEIALRGVHDVAIIDWMLPGKDGPSIIRSIRAAKIPLAILMLTARTQIEDRVLGLNSGADDYLIKPFAFEELLARILALGRRCSNLDGNTGELRIGEIVMDIRGHSVRRAESVLELTKTEWDLLEYFLRHPGQTLTRQNILDYVWSYENKVKPEMVDVYISYLRKKLNLPLRADPIKTIRGVGYRLDSEDA